MGWATQASLELRLLGELEVVRDGRLVALPQSKKTRALLAYLALTERQHRRDHLCALFWDVADDPRGALRWSLSKLRAVLDEPRARRIEADRDRVALEPRGMTVDALALRKALAARPVAEHGTDELERAAAAFRGEPLEGLDLPDFDEYQAWCVAERERARTLRVAILAELTRRLDSDPPRAIEHASTWSRLDPMNETARAQLVRLLGACGRREEARQHYESGRRLEKELGRPSRGELEAAWRGIDAPARAASAPSMPVQPVVARTPGGPPLVGRRDELDALDMLAADVAAKRSLAVRLVTGEAGIGKTRLLGEWMDGLRGKGSIVLNAASYEAESRRPYAPWIDALSSADGDDPFALEAAPATTRDRLFAAVGEAIARRTERAPVVAIVLDDAQWLDGDSAELLHWVARSNRARPLLVVLAARAGEIADNAALLRVSRAFRRDGVLSELEIGPLPEGAVATLVRAIGSKADAARVFAQCGGNALFALEIARAGGGTDDVSATLTGLVRDRIAQLPPEAADVLRWAAVLGATTTAVSIAELSTIGMDAVIAALEQLEARSLLARDPDRRSAYAFAHDIVRRVVYADLSEPRRRLMHHRIATMLASRTDAGVASIADLAYHADLAHDSRLAAEACLGAARRALRLFANADAFTLARRGTKHAELMDEPGRTRRLIELAEVQFAARRPEDLAKAAAYVQTLAERALDLGSAEHARLAFHILSYLSWETGGWSDAERHMRDAERVSRGASEQERVRAMAEAARCLVLLERDLGHAQALALEAAARGKQVGVEPSATFDALGLLALHQGHLADATAKLEQARALARVARDHQDEFQALEHLVVADIERGDLVAARRRAEELVVIGERFREGSEAPFARCLLALTGLGVGIEDAERALATELDALTVADAKHRLAYVLTRSARFDADAGRLDVARRRAAEALAIGQTLGRPTETAFALAILIRCACANGDREEAARHRRALDAVPTATIASGVKTVLEALDA